jgi:hypothetical protein
MEHRETPKIEMRTVNGIELDDGVDEPGALEWHMDDDWCDCKDSTIRRVDADHPHPAMTREGWFCMGCLQEFVPHNAKGQGRDTAALDSRQSETA